MAKRGTLEGARWQTEDALTRIHTDKQKQRECAHVSAPGAAGRGWWSCQHCRARESESAPGEDGMNRHQGKHQSLLSVWCALGPGAAAGTVPRRSHAGSPPRRQRRAGSMQRGQQARATGAAKYLLLPDELAENFRQENPHPLAGPHSFCRAWATAPTTGDAALLERRKNVTKKKQKNKTSWRPPGSSGQFARVCWQSGGKTARREARRLLRRASGHRPRATPLYATPCGTDAAGASHRQHRQGEQLLRCEPRDGRLCVPCRLRSGLLQSSAQPPDAVLLVREQPPADERRLFG